MTSTSKHQEFHTRSYTQVGSTSISIPDFFPIFTYIYLSSWVRREHIQVSNHREHLTTYWLILYLSRNLHKVDTPSGAACEFVMARMPLSTTAQLVWIGKDLGPSVLALLKNYQNKGKEILGQTFTVVSQLITVEELVKTIQEGKLYILVPGICLADTVTRSHRKTSHVQIA